MMRCVDLKTGTMVPHMSIDTSSGIQGRVLLIETSSALHALLKECIESRGNFHVVEESRTGKEALKNLLQIDPDIVVVDVNPTEAKALEILKTVYETNPRISIIALSFDIEDSFQKKCLVSGAKFFLPLPCHAELLQQTLNECLEKGE